MSNEEQLEHKRVQVIYLYKLLKGVNEEIAELEQLDPYAELKAAHAAGKRIAFNHDALDNNAWSFQVGHISFGGFAADRYKIVGDNLEYTGTYLVPSIGSVKVKITKCALTGKLTAEVLNAY